MQRASGIRSRFSSSRVSRPASSPELPLFARGIACVAAALLVVCGGWPEPAGDSGDKRGAQPRFVRAPHGPPPGGARTASVRFAVIGDYGASGADEQAVATLVNRLRPDFVVTTGDNNYPSGGADTIDENIGRYYHQFIGNYQGRWGPGSTTNRFFPVLGNHDWYTAGAKPYLDYFHLPNNERYYDVSIGDVHVFAVDSDANEPDGITGDSVQAAWLMGRLGASTARWNAVFFHHPPYSSGVHGSTPALQWPFGAWGAQIVFSGHDHSYERLAIDGVTYIVNGLGGNVIYDLEPPIEGSITAYNGAHGAILVEADAERLISTFLRTDGQVVDTVTLP